MKVNKKTHQHLSAFCSFDCDGMMLKRGQDIQTVVFPVAGENLVNVLDCKKDMGLWHGVLTVRMETSFDTCSKVIFVLKMEIGIL